MTTNKDLNGQFIEEFNLVQDNANKLIVGEKYSYPKLMELLKLPIKKGECRTSQIKRIQHYIQWDTKTKVYSGIIEDAIPVLKKTNTSAYYELVKDCLLFKLQEFIEEHPNVPYLYLSYDRAIYMCDLVSEGFLLTKTFDGSEIAGALLGISGNFIRKYREQLRKDAISITNNTLKNMKKDNLIYYEEVNKLNYTKDNHDEINVEDSDNYFDTYVISLDKINTTDVCNKELYLQKKKELKNKLKEKMLTCKAKELLNVISKDCIDEIQIHEKINKLNAVLIDDNEEFNELLLKRLNDMGVEIKESRKRIFRKLNSSTSTTLKNDNNVYNCIYRWVNENNKIVYIGKTKDLVQRTRMHLVARNDKLHTKWLTNNLRLEYVSFKEYGDCSVAEPYFIMKYKPIGNSDFTTNDISISIPQFDELEWKEFDFDYSFN